MMYAIANVIRALPALYAVISVLDSAVHITGCAMVSVLLFRLTRRKAPGWYICAAGLCLAVNVAEVFLMGRVHEFGELVYSVITMLLPYACMLLIFPPGGVWKALLCTLGYTFVEALRFLILLFFKFDNNNRNNALELLVEFLVDVACFLLIFALLTRRARKNRGELQLTRSAALLFVLIVASVTVFVTSIMLLSPEFSSQRQTEFAFILLNIPVLTATVSYALVSFFRMRNQSETYREQLNMQIRQYEWMEQMNEDLRMFRHDFPKKMRPLIAYLEGDRPDEAKEMAEQFMGFVAETGKTFRTGNYRLDTVLNCQQQIAKKDGIEIRVPFGATFPKEGISPDDIYTIFPNALDNAIEACRNVEGERVIDFTSRVAGNTVYITIANPYTGELKQRGGAPVTGKTDKKNHGYGFRSIKKAAANYGKDNVSFTAENGVFELRIFLMIPE